LRFGGVVISDDLEMKAIADHFSIAEAVTRGLNAGVDLFLVCHTPQKQREAIDQIVRAVEQGRVARERLEEAAGRVGALAQKFARPASDADPGAILNCAAHQALAQRMREAAPRGLETPRDPTQWRDLPRGRP
jgi:beta-N-acetylhexosaminidase